MRTSRCGVLTIVVFAATLSLRFYGIHAATQTESASDLSSAWHDTSGAVDAAFEQPPGIEISTLNSRLEASGGKRTLLQSPDDPTVAEEIQCRLAPQQIQRSLDVETRTWLIDNGAWEAVANDLQAIVDCTQPDDVLLFRVESTIIPATTVTLPWNLTLSRFLRTIEPQNGVFPETRKKTIFSCPPDQGLFHLRSRDVWFANLVFENCSLSSGGAAAIISAEACAEGQTGSLLLHHVSFRGNRLEGGSALGAASCVAVEMVDVEFSDNECSGVCFAELSLENRLQEVQMRRNAELAQPAPFHALLRLPPRSTTEVVQLTTQINQITALYVDGGALRITDSSFEQNSEASVMVLEQSRRVSIQNCSFLENEAIAVSGAAIRSNGTRSLILSETNFTSNSAERGGAVASLDTDLLIRDCQFSQNSARDAAGALLVSGSIVELEETTFQNNTASRHGGSIAMAGTPAATISELSCAYNAAITGGCLHVSNSTGLSIHLSTIRGNQASFGGGMAFENVSTVSLFTNDIQQNRASDEGGSIWLQRCESVQISNTNLSSSSAGRTGGGFHCQSCQNLTLIQTHLSGNTADLDGGGVYLERSEISLNATTWTGNRATVKGGGFYAFRSNASVQNSQFLGNRGFTGAGFQVTEGDAVVDSSAFTSNIAEAAGGGLEVIRGSLRLDNSTIQGNLGHRGGGVDVLTCFAEISNTQFLGNVAHTSRGGGLACHDSNMTLGNLTFLSNLAVNSGGAIDMALCLEVRGDDLVVRQNQCRNVAGGIGVYQRSVFNLSRAVIQGNQATLSGGGISESFNATLRLRHSSVEGNRARTAAGISISTNSTIILENSTVATNVAEESAGGVFSQEAEIVASQSRFVNNSCSRNGGSIYAQTSQVTLVESILTRGRAMRGGGIYGLRNASVTLDGCDIFQNQADDEGGAVRMEDSAVSVKGTHFGRNNASVGGSMLLKNSSASLENSTFTQDVASLAGGSIAALDNSTVSISETSIGNASAQSGAALWLKQSNLTAFEMEVAHCRVDNDGGGVLANASSHVLCRACSFRNNEAGRGGAVALDSTTPQSIAYHFDACRFRKNNASLGGAIHVSTSQETRSCHEARAECTFLAVTGCHFVQNTANLSGGAVFTRNPHALRYSCASQTPLVPPNADRDEAFRSLDILRAPESPCPQWMRNTAGRYGDTAGSYAWEALGYTILGDSGAVPMPNGSFAFHNHRSGDPFPVVLVELLDGYRQGPALGNGDVDVQATIQSRDGFFAGALSVALDEDRKAFPAISSFQRPENYTVSVDFSQPGIDSLLLEIQVRGCTIGEQAANNETFCVECNGAQYNFHPESENCTVCPEHGNCTLSNVIQPMPGYWHRTPCSVHIQQCVTQEACDFTGRDAELQNVTRDLTDCRINSTTDELYADAQCRTGYEDALCGSCSDGYGRSQSYRCEQCYGRPGSVFLFLLSLFVLLMLSSFAIRSNMNSSVSAISRRGAPSRTSRGALSYRRGLGSDAAVPVNFQMVEMLSTGHVPPEIIQPERRRAPPSPDATNKRAAIAKGRFVEIFKILINFLQSIAVAVAINANWNAWMRSLFSVADFIGGGTTDGIVLSVDCIFSSDTETPRSILRTVLLFLVPLAMLLLFVAFWAVASRRRGQNSSYFAKRCLLSALVVAYLTYVTCTKTAVNTLYCITVHDSAAVDLDGTTRRWAMDSSVVCYRGSHAVLAGVAAWPALLLISAGFPIAVAYILVKLRSTDTATRRHLRDASGFLYRAYRDRFVFWESVVMLRKALLAIIAVLGYPLGVNVQGILAVCVLMIAGYAHAFCHPFKEEFGELNSYEGASLLVSQLTFASALFFNDQRPDDAAKIGLTIVLTICIVGLVLFLAIQFVKSAATYAKTVLELEGYEETEGWTTMQTLRTYASTVATEFCFRLFTRRRTNQRDVQGPSVVANGP